MRRAALGQNVFSRKKLFSILQQIFKELIQVIIIASELEFVNFNQSLWLTLATFTVEAAIPLFRL